MCGPLTVSAGSCRYVGKSFRMVKEYARLDGAGCHRSCQPYPISQKYCLSDIE
jgi:hypothetical protein